jgi:hypothetical protein
LSAFEFDARMPLPRVRTIPPWLLKEWADADGKPYKAHEATPSELKALAAAYAGLPKPIQDVLLERLIAVYLVDGLKGNGITDWALDASSRPYVYTILNAAGFKQTVSKLMTERDLTLFRGKADFRVEAGDLNGIVYTVAHESAHAFDYVVNVTPYTEPGLHGILHPGAAPAAWDVWDDYAKPKPASDYPLRAKLRFYGFGAPELDSRQAGELCAQWEAGPFASYYGSRSWAEDFAELFVLRHLTQDLAQPVRRVCGGKAVSPWDNLKVRERAFRLTAPLYR